MAVDKKKRQAALERRHKNNKGGQTALPDTVTKRESKFIRSHWGKGSLQDKHKTVKNNKKFNAPHGGMTPKQARKTVQRENRKGKTYVDPGTHQKPGGGEPRINPSKGIIPKGYYTNMPKKGDKPKDYASYSARRKKHYGMTHEDKKGMTGLETQRLNKARMKARFSGGGDSKKETKRIQALRRRLQNTTFQHRQGITKKPGQQGSTQTRPPVKNTQPHGNVTGVVPPKPKKKVGTGPGMKV